MISESFMIVNVLYVQSVFFLLIFTHGKRRNGKFLFTAHLIFSITLIKLFVTLPLSRSCFGEILNNEKFQCLLTQFFLLVSLYFKIIQISTSLFINFERTKIQMHCTFGEWNQNFNRLWAGKLVAAFALWCSTTIHLFSTARLKHRSWNFWTRIVQRN